MGQQLMSVMIDEEITSELRKHCYLNGIKIKNFVADAIKEKINANPSGKKLQRKGKG